MPFPFDPVDSRVRVSTTENGTYNDVGKVRRYNMTEGTEGGATLKYFGGQAKKAGDPTVGATVDVWWDDTDTNGQQILRAYKRTGAILWFQFAAAGTAAYAEVHQFSALVTEVSEDADAEAEAVEGSFTIDGDADTLSTETLA
jgi:hypothetical protein